MILEFLKRNLSLSNELKICMGKKFVGNSPNKRNHKILRILTSQQKDKVSHEV